VSVCVGLSVRAGELIALLRNACIFSRLLLIFDVESPSSLLAAASAAVMACSLLMRSARRLCLVVQSFTDGCWAR
jgi:hypothetical protein